MRAFFFKQQDVYNIGIQKNCCFHCNAYLNKAFVPDLEILLKYSLFDVILVWPNQSAGSFPKLRYLKIKNYHLHQKEYHFLPNLPYNNEKDEPATNSISYSKYKTVNCTLYCVKQFSLNFYTVFGLW